MLKIGPGNAARGVEGTLWAAYNGVTDYVDHHRPENGTSDAFLRSVWFGQRDKIKRRAAKEAERMAAKVG